MLLPNMQLIISSTITFLMVLNSNYQNASRCLEYYKIDVDWYNGFINISEK